MDITECGLCGERVILNNGICPSCNGNPSDENEVIKRKSIDVIWNIIVDMQHKGYSWGNIKKSLNKTQFDSKIIELAVNEYDNKILIIKHEIYKLQIIPGFLLFSVGLIVTVLSYWISMTDGGSWIYWYGAIAVGFGLLVRGIYMIRKLS